VLTIRATEVLNAHVEERPSKWIVCPTYPRLPTPVTPMLRIPISAIAIFLVLSEHSCSFSCSTGGNAATSGQTSYFLILFLGGAGLLMFYGGFRSFRKFRILEDTPMMPIRSIPMGLVHIHGKPTGGNLLTSPITHVPCFHYVVQVDQWYDDDDRGGKWTLGLRHVDRVPYHLQDATGKVLVDPHLAEMELTPTFVGETGRRAKASRTIDAGLKLQHPPADSELIGYFRDANDRIQAEMAARHASAGNELASFMEHSVSKVPSAKTASTAGHRLRFTEGCLLPDREYRVLGTCVENPHPQDERDRNMIARGQNESSYIISWKTEAAIERQTRRNSLALILAGSVLIVIAGALTLKGFGLF